MNALLGETRAVTAVGATESTVETDISNTLPADAYAGASLRVGQDCLRGRRERGRWTRSRHSASADDQECRSNGQPPSARWCALRDRDSAALH